MNLSGVITCDPYKILESSKNCYKDFYTSKHPNLDSDESKLFFENGNIPKLSEELYRVCEGKVSIEEITEVLSSCKDNKVPGIDGLPTEFYKKFWHLLSHRLVETFNAAFDSGHMSTSQKQAINSY